MGESAVLAMLASSSCEEVASGSLAATSAKLTAAESTAHRGAAAPGSLASARELRLRCSSSAGIAIQLWRWHGKLSRVERHSVVVEERVEGLPSMRRLGRLAVRSDGDILLLCALCRSSLSLVVVLRRRSLGSVLGLDSGLVSIRARSSLGAIWCTTFRVARCALGGREVLGLTLEWRREAFSLVRAGHVRRRGHVDWHWHASVCILHWHGRSHSVEMLGRSVGRVTIAGRRLVENGSLSGRHGSRSRVGRERDGVRKDALVAVATVGEELARNHPGDLGRRKVGGTAILVSMAALVRQRHALEEGRLGLKAVRVLLLSHLELSRLAVESSGLVVVDRSVGKLRRFVSARLESLSGLGSRLKHASNLRVALRQILIQNRLRLCS